MFRSLFEIIDRIRRPSQPMLPFGGLTEEDIKLLELLATKREYRAFIKALDCRSHIIADSLLSSPDAYHDTLRKGTLIGLRTAGTLVDEILAQRKHASQSERSRLDRSPDLLQRTAATYGSPAWANPDKH